MLRRVVPVVLMVLGCGGLATPPQSPPPPPVPAAPAKPAGPDLTGLSGTWCHVKGWCYTYNGSTIIDESSGRKGTWRQEDNLYISQFGTDVPWVATIEKYTTTQLIVVALDDNTRIVYSKR